MQLTYRNHEIQSIQNITETLHITKVSVDVFCECGIICLNAV